MTARPPPTRPHIGISSPFGSTQDWGEDDAWDSASDSESPRQSSLSSNPSTTTKRAATTSFSSSSHQPTPAMATTTTAPKPVPRSSSNSSSSTLAFSYTHLQAPGSSYPPKTTTTGLEKSRSSTSSPHQNGWTIVRKKSHTSGQTNTQDSLSSASSSRQQHPNLNPDDDDEDEDDEDEDDDEDRNNEDDDGRRPSKSPQIDIDLEQELVLGDLDPELSTTTATDHSYITLPGPAVRSDAQDVVNDPLLSIHIRPRTTSRGTSPSGRDSATTGHHKERNEKLMRERSIKSNRRHKFVECLSSPDVNIAELRKLAWAGIPNDFRPVAWQLLLGYLPLPTSSRLSTLKRKREEYLSLVQLAFARDREGLDQQIWHQIEIDVPRTRPGVRLWMHGATQRSLERILYVWAIRHPASGYVQGINDLVTPFFQIFLSAYIDSDPELFDPANLPKPVLDAIEADSFWCLSRLLDGIQDNYIFAQPGIQRSVRRMAELVGRIDAPLFSHLESQNVEFMQFAFRWMNCLLMREISVKNTIRMWDTYLAEGPDAFSQFHLYVCSAFLVKWSDKLRTMDFQGVIMFLQSLPTQDWGDHEIEMLLSEAFVLNSIWANAQSHFNG